MTADLCITFQRADASQIDELLAIDDDAGALFTEAGFVFDAPTAYVAAERALDGGSAAGAGSSARSIRRVRRGASSRCAWWTHDPMWSSSRCASGAAAGTRIFVTCAESSEPGRCPL